MKMDSPDETSSLLPALKASGSNVSAIAQTATGGLYNEHGIYSDTEDDIDDDDDEESRRQKQSRKKKKQRTMLRESKKIKMRIHMYLNEYKKLSTYFERSLIEHKLAREYYSYRAFWLNFIPLTILSGLTSILGFFITGGNYFSEDGEDESNKIVNSGAGEDVEGIPLFEEPFFKGELVTYISLAIGIIGALSVIVTTFGKYMEYESHASLHKAAIKALDKIRLNVSLEIQWFERGSMSNTEIVKNVSEDKTDETLQKLESKGADLAAHHAKIVAMNDAFADAPIPDVIVQEFGSLKQYCMDEFGYESVPVKKEHNIALITFLYHRLWKEFSRSWRWPLYVPAITVLNKVEKWKGEFEQMNDA